MLTSDSRTPSPSDDTPCEILGVTPSRRAFVRGASAALGALALLGLDADAAMALPVRLLKGRAGVGGTVRFPIPADDSVLFDDTNGLIIVRRGKAAWAFLSTCPHKDIVKLKWYKAENRFQCPKHDSRYEASGVFVDGRATRNMDRVAIKKEGTELVVEPDAILESDRDLAKWTGAVAAL
jgi:nitrite reductase/ring-hydroxylating ferredoxin subunit